VSPALIENPAALLLGVRHSHSELEKDWACPPVAKGWRISKRGPIPADSSLPDGLFKVTAAGMEARHGNDGLTDFKPDASAIECLLVAVHAEAELALITGVDEALWVAFGSFEVAHGTGASRTASAPEWVLSAIDLCLFRRAVRVDGPIARFRRPVARGPRGVTRCATFPSDTELPDQVAVHFG
jgi:hypothetical protein